MFGDQPLIPQNGTLKTLFDYIHDLYVEWLKTEKATAKPPTPVPIITKTGRAAGKSTTIARAAAVANEQNAENVRLWELSFEPTLVGYLAFANAYLKKFPASNPLYLEQGIGVRLVNGDIVSLGPSQHEQGMRDEGVRITRGATIPGLHGVIPSYTVPITGPGR